MGGAFAFVARVFSAFRRAMTEAPSDQRSPFSQYSFDPSACVLHRDGGPAVIRPARGGVEFWFYQFGKVHRDYGPAIIRADGSKQWFRDGKCHREDGPAIEQAAP